MTLKCVNKCVAGRTDEESRKVYYEENKKSILENQKIHYDKKKESILEKNCKNRHVFVVVNIHMSISNVIVNLKSVKIVY